MNSRERVLASLDHHQPDKIPVDLGATSCSTLHVSCVEQLREHYRLPKEPVTTLAISFMTAIIPAELADRMGVDTVAAITRGGSFGMPREDYKLWTTPWGQQVRVPGMFNPTPDGEGGWFAHPQGDTSCPPSGHMPTKCAYFDNIEPDVEFDEDHLDPADNVAEYAVARRSGPAVHRPQRGRRALTGRAVVLGMPGTGLGDINRIPGTGLKHPKGIRTIEEWYVSPLHPPGLRAGSVRPPDGYRLGQPAEDQRRLRRQDRRCEHLRNRFRPPERAILQPRRIP